VKLVLNMHSTVKSYINKVINYKYFIPLLCLVIILLPLIISNAYFIHIMNIIGIYIIYTLSLDLLLGTVGMTQLGQMGFCGCGAYIGSILATRVLLGNSSVFWISIILAFIITMILGLAIGVTTLRLKGIFFALCTLGFGEIMRTLFLNLVNITGGPYGIKAIPSPIIFGFELSDKKSFFYLIYFFVALTIWIIYSLKNSKYGLFWRTIREDEIVSSAVGIDVFRQKNIALMISAGLSGIGGVIFAYYLGYISPSNFTLDASILVLTMAIIGGRDSIFGSIIGAAIMIALPEVLRGLSDYRMLIYGIGLVCMIIYRPEGMMGKHG